MKQSKILRRSLLCGLGVLSLAAVGCGGGGGGTIVEPTTLTLTNGAGNGSLSKVSNSSSRTSRRTLPPVVVLDCYDLSGNLLATLPSYSFGDPITLGDTVTSALQNDSLVIRATSSTDANFSFRSVIKIDSSRFGSGAIKATDGSDLAEAVNTSSTVVTQLVEEELESVTGIELSLGEKSTPEAKSALKNLVELSTKKIDTGVLANSLKTGLKTGTSAIAKLVAGIPVNANVRDFLARPTDAATRLLVKNTKTVSKLVRKLSRLSLSSLANTATFNTRANEIANLPVDATFDTKAAGVESITQVADLAIEKPALFGAHLTTLDSTTLEAVNAVVVDQVLPTAVNNAGDLGQEALDQTAGLLGAALQTGDASQTTKLAESFTALSSIGNADSFAGTVLKIASQTTKGAERALVNIDTAGLNINTVAATLGTLDASLAETVIGAVKTRGLDVSSFYNAIVGNINVEDLVILGSQSTALGLDASLFSDNARISGPIEARSGSVFGLKNSSLGADLTATYSYNWTVSPTASDLVASDDSVSFTATSTTGYSVTLVQSKNGTAINTATHAVDTVAGLKPTILVSTLGYSISLSEVGVLFVEIVDPEVRTTVLDVTPITGITFGNYNASDKKLSITPTVAGDFVINLRVMEGSTVLETKTVNLQVRPVIGTRAFVSGIFDRTAGGTAIISGTGVQLAAITSGTLNLSVTHSSSATPVASSSVALLKESKSTSVTVSNLVSGTYTVVLTAKAGTTTLKTVTKSFNVKETGAPTFSKLMAAGVNVLETNNIRVVGSEDTTSISVEAMAAVVGSTSTTVTYTSKFGSNAASSTLTQTVAVGTHVVVVTATAGGKSVVKNFNITYVQAKKLAVSSVAIAGGVISAGQLVNSVANNVYTMNASTVTGLTLNTSDLALTVTVDQAKTQIPATSNGYNFEVSLTDPTSSRSATLKVVNATLVGTAANGFAVTAADSLFFTGKKSSGTGTGSISVSTSAVTNFSSLFTAVNGGLKVDLIALKDAMKQVLGSNTFAASLDTLVGTNLVVTIKMTGSNFKMTNSGDVRFDTFSAINVNVN